MRIHTYSDRQTDRQTDRDRERETDRERQRERERENQRDQKYSSYLESLNNCRLAAIIKPDNQHRHRLLRHSKRHQHALEDAHDALPCVSHAFPTFPWPREEVLLLETWSLVGSRALALGLRDSLVVWESERAMMAAGRLLFSSTTHHRGGGGGGGTVLAAARSSGPSSTAAPVVTEATTQPPVAENNVTNSSSRVHPRPETMKRRKKHLIVFVHGFMGLPSNWQYIASLMEDRGASCPSTSRRSVESPRNDRNGTYDACDDDAEDVVVMVSQSNAFLRTRDGVETCARRLCDEVKTFCGMHGVYAGAEGSAISFVGHSFGGLIARYAIALLLDQGSGTICGFLPRHYISIASPHAGVANGELPFLNVAGKRVGAQLASIANPIVSALGSQTVRELFLQSISTKAKKEETSSSSATPLLRRMASEPRFIAALSSFRSRTAYANVENSDMMVGPKTSSLLLNERDLEGNWSGAVGIVREEEDSSVASKAHADLSDDDDSEVDDKTFIIRSLSQLQWRRVLVSFSGSMPMMGHNNIQVSRRWMNSCGREVAEHIVNRILSDPSL